MPRICTILHEHYIVYIVRFHAKAKYSRNHDFMRTIGFMAVLTAASEMQLGACSFVGTQKAYNDLRFGIFAGQL